MKFSYMSLKITAGLLFASLLASGCARAIKSTSPKLIADLKPTVILVSLDGFKPAYLGAQTPHLNEIAKAGVKARYMQPVFPSLTFPNHYSIVTGEYPQKHGIVGNTIYDPARDALFTLGSAAVDEAVWWGGEPIWVTAQRQNQIAATMFWVGSTAAVGGVRPRYWRPYSKSVRRDERVEQVLTWLDLPQNERPTLLTLYLEDTDTQGHQHGPDSKEVIEASSQVDQAIGKLIDGLRARGIENKIDLIVVSDHGMAKVETANLIELEPKISESDAKVIGSGPTAGVIPARGKMNLVYKLLKSVSKHMQVYKKNEIPARYHYRDNDKIQPILLVADEGYMIDKKRTSRPMPSGMHGYDNELESMRAIFIAKGPDFKTGYEAEPFLNIHVYSLLCKLLGLKPNPDADSSLEPVQQLLIH